MTEVHYQGTNVSLLISLKRSGPYNWQYQSLDAIKRTTNRVSVNRQFKTHRAKVLKRYKGGIPAVVSETSRVSDYQGISVAGWGLGTVRRAAGAVSTGEMRRDAIQS